MPEPGSGYRSCTKQIDTTGSGDQLIGQVFSIDVRAVEALRAFLIAPRPSGALGSRHLEGVGAARWSVAARR